MENPRSTEAHHVGDDTLPRGATVGRYVVVSVLGRGGMGVVYSAYDTQLDRKIAIKLLRPDLVAAGAEPTEIESRLLREAQAMARLTHPNVVAVHDVGTFEHRVFLAMEFIDGCTLKEWLKTPRSLRERLAALKYAGRGLAAAHAAGLVHRDLKPDNVLVGLDGRVLVTDFGLARAAGDTTPEAPLPMLPQIVGETGPTGSLTSRPTSSLEAPLTLTGSVLGTVGYLAPEQAFGEVTNAATDQFSYAVTLYLALYGEKPFPGDSIEDYLTSVDLPVRDPVNDGGVPPWMRRVILRGLAPRPDDRYPSLDAFLDALDRDPTLVWRKAATVVLAAVIAILGVVGTASLFRKQASECKFDNLPLKGVWDDSVHSAMVSAFEKTGAEGAKASAERLAGKMSEWATKWGEERTEVCKATRITKTQPEDVYKLRMDCLDRQLTLVRSVSRMVVGADLQVVKKSLDVAYGLPQLAWCADVATLRGSAGLPDNPTERAKVLAIRSELAESNSLSLAGKDREAALLATHAVEQARETHHGSTTAEALLRAGQAQRLLGAFPEAEPLLREAVFGALASGADSTAVQAASMSAYVVGAKLRKPELAAFWVEAARAALDRLGGRGGTLEYEVIEAEAAIASEVEWRPEKAVAMETQLVESYRALYGVHPKTARALYSLGVDYAYLGQFENARTHYEAALAMNEAVGGPNFMETGRSEYVLGDALVALGRGKEGAALLTKAIGVFGRLDSSYWKAITLQAAVRAAMIRGDTDDAVRMAEESLDQLEKTRNTSVLVPIVKTVAGKAFIMKGRFDAALALCSTAVAEQERSQGLEPDKVYGWDALACKAAALIGLHRAEEAVPLLERSLTLKRRMFPGDFAHAEFLLARALDATNRDASKARVRGLVHASRDEFARYPHLEIERATIEAWIAAHAAVL